jgi:glyoxylase-like metal-dependent hydrolase (beta-lactamase superfamily II)
METLAPGVHYFDLHFHNRVRAIACVLLQGPGGVTLLDPGPTSTLPTVRQTLDAAGMALSDVTNILLTHIHLDHAGSVGTLVREHPHIQVYVHERGVQHLIDPSKLLASAGRLYGDLMDRLWGEVAPVPPTSLVALAGGERLAVSGRLLDVEYTPGHASHHVSYFSSETGVAFVGDTAGIRPSPHGFVLPPTPPPDIDLDLWMRSLDTIGRWQADTLLLTHFGAHQGSAPHLAELRDHLDLVSGLARRSLAIDGEDSAKEQWFVDELRRELRKRLNEVDAARYETSGRFDLNWRGLARYWRKRQ